MSLTIIVRPKFYFTRDCENPKVGELRYRNYLSRYQATVKMVLDERKHILGKNNGSFISKNGLHLSLPQVGSVRNLGDYQSVITSSNTNHRGVHLMPSYSTN